MTLKVIALSFVFLFMTGCDEALYPIDIAEKFWRAVKEKDAKKIQEYSSKDSLKTNKPGQNILPLDEITLGKTVIDGETAWVDTTVTISGDKPFTVPLRTVLLRENKQWKVDYDTTISLVSEDSSVSRVIGSIKNLSEGLATELNKSMEDLQEDLQERIPEIKEEVEKIEDSLMQQIPELQKQIEEFVRDLKEAIKGLGEEPKEVESTVTET